MKFVCLFVFVEINQAEPFFKDPNRHSEMADPLLKGNFPKKSLNQAVAVSAMCLNEDPSVRPLISDVVTALSYLWTGAEEEAEAGMPSPRPPPPQSSIPKLDDDHKNDSAKERQRAIAEAMEWGSNSRDQNTRSSLASQDS